MKIRLATADDADELIRLRAIMLRTFKAANWNDDWRDPTREVLHRRLGAAEPTLAAVVVDHPDGSGLAACAVGAIEERFGNPSNPGGRVGYVFNVCTDPAMRRRGYSRACMEALLQWFRDEGVRAVDLKALPDGEPLYRSLGFVPGSQPEMRLNL